MVVPSWSYYMLSGTLEINFIGIISVMYKDLLQRIFKLQWGPQKTQTQKHFWTHQVWNCFLFHSNLWSESRKVTAGNRGLNSEFGVLMTTMAGDKYPNTTWGKLARSLGSRCSTLKWLVGERIKSSFICKYFPNWFIKTISICTLIYPFFECISEQK